MTAVRYQVPELLFVISSICTGGPELLLQVQVEYSLRICISLKSYVEWKRHMVLTSTLLT